MRVSTIPESEQIGHRFRWSDDGSTLFEIARLPTRQAWHIWQTRVRGLTRTAFVNGSVDLGGDVIDWQPSRSGGKISFLIEAESSGDAVKASDFNSLDHGVEATAEIFDLNISRPDSAILVDTSASRSKRRVTISASVGRLLRVQSSRVDSLQVWSHGSGPDTGYFYPRYRLVPLGLQTALYRIGTPGAAPTPIASHDLHTYGPLIYSANHRFWVVSRESVVDPPELLVGSVDDTVLRPLVGPAAFAPRWATISKPTFDTLTWQSADGQFPIHAAVIKPIDMSDGHRYPLIVANMGGPSAALWRFNLGDHSYPYLILAAHGNLILWPNTRGRGGVIDPRYADAMAHAREREMSPVHHMTQDALSGINALAQLGWIDSTRLGVMGFSYGGFISADATAMTHIFRAASIGEPGTDFVLWWMLSIGGPYEHQRAKEAWGQMPNIYTPEVLSFWQRESPLYQVLNVDTPTLIENGDRSALLIDGRRWFEALQFLRVPSEQVVYPRSAHGWFELALVRDSYARNVAWFDYWLHNVPYPDKDRQREYDAWKRARSRQRDPRWLCVDRSVDINARDRDDRCAA